MTQGRTQAAIEAMKAAIMAVRQTDKDKMVDNTRLVHIIPIAGIPALKQ